MRLRGEIDAGPSWPPDDSWPERLRAFRRADWPASSDEVAQSEFVSAQLAYLPTNRARLAVIQQMTATPARPPGTG
ncbi:hypothetical protein B4U45_27930 [Mycobacterium persicum]|uniref:Uncharacterized protein n=1 Tax=Mycobacterium persicum TaxID=1487726 RepID=A0A8E2LQQ4_9MYCO|nr:hypothetical protein [Mycobacterium persicum]KZS80262.1 hypothetical protein A4G31_26740 [Mycobacterium persicum]ORB39763.1 hypothetical protein BST40_22390 [Mycobacterium persicum]ORB97790.1 hypothetical protein B1T44_28415 [Mycobacterium persicum]ORC09859.1 hypothetical protein B4U45_27930 [Mycobacterium persicum]